jgi:hypothetical protein
MRKKKRQRKRRRRRRKKMKIMYLFLLSCFTVALASIYGFSETGVSGSTSTGGGVGKYLKARTAGSVDVTANGATDDSGKRRKVSASTVEFKDFSGW